MKRTILSFLFTLALWGTAQAASITAGNRPNSNTVSTTVVNYNLIQTPTGEQAGSENATARILAWTQSVSFRLARRIEQGNCLATAIYFEARSEPVQGQMAVAAVILNRVKALHYPATICGVVYQNAHRRNACQFSFACDGKPDIPTERRAWEMSVTIARQVLNGALARNQLCSTDTATHYHADYVNPKWSRSLNRLVKIGRHIFYSRDREFRSHG